MPGTVKKTKYCTHQCPDCKHWFGGYKGLNQHQHGSRCARAKAGKLDNQDIEMIAKYPGKFKAEVFH